MRRNVGLSSLARRDESLASYSSLSNSITAAQVDVLSAQMTTFKNALRLFASKHRGTIARDPNFRAQFAKMCSELGVDPLGGGQKGLWDYVGVGEWTYALAVQVVDVCIASRERNGGLMEIDEVLRAVAWLREGDDRLPKALKTKSSAGAVTSADIVRAIKSLEPLGCGYTILDVGGRRMVRSLPAEFDLDSLVLLECAAELPVPKVSYDSLASFTRRREGGQWTNDRIYLTFDKALLIDGLVWIDTQADQPEYWVPALIDFGT